MKTFFFLLLLSMGLIGQNSAQQLLIINGDIKGVQDNSAVFLTNLNNTTDTVARGVIQSGKFKLTGHVEEPNLYEINFASVQKKLPLFIGNDNISMNGDVNDLKTLQVTGSSSQNDFIEFQQVFNDQILHLNSLAQVIQSRPNISKEDTVFKEYLGVIHQINAAEDQFLQKKKSSYISPFVVVVLMKLTDDIFLLEKRLNALDPQVQNSYYGKYLRQNIASEKAGAVGSEEIDFTQNNTDGKPVSLSSFKGKYVLVDFWASWCHPCRMENPNVVAVYNKFKTKNFTILSVSLDKEKNPWLQAIKDDNLTWTHVSDLKFWNNDVAIKYHVQSIPQNFLIDPSGKIVAKNLRGADLESKLCEYLGCN